MHKGVKMIFYALKMLCFMLLTVLAVDLFYLYYNGSWYDPVKAIELTEVILLYGLAILGIIMVIKGGTELK